MEVDRRFYRGFEYFQMSKHFYGGAIFRNGVYVMYVNCMAGTNDFRIYVDQHYDELMQWYKHSNVNHLIRNCNEK